MTGLLAQSKLMEFVVLSAIMNLMMTVFEMVAFAFTTKNSWEQFRV